MVTASERRRSIVVAVLSALALGGATIARAVTSELVEMEVLGVVPMESEAASLLVLRQKGARTVLPVFVGRHEATDIDLHLKQPGRMLSHRSDLLRRSIEALGGKVSRVVIESTEATTFTGRVTLEHGGRKVDVDGRASDSVALALAARAPIYASRNLVTQAGITEDDLAKKHGDARRGTPDTDTGGEAGASAVVSF